MHGEIQRLLAVNSPGAPLYFWAAHGSAEVDFVREYGGRFHLLEARLGSHPGSQALGGFRAFESTYGEAAIARRTIVCRTPGSYVLDGRVDVVDPLELALDS